MLSEVLDIKDWIRVSASTYFFDEDLKIILILGIKSIYLKSIN